MVLDSMNFYGGLVDWPHTEGYVDEMSGQKQLLSV